MAYQSAEQAEISIDGNEPERLTQQAVSGSYFPVLGAQPAAGRLISTLDDEAPSAVAVISYRLWTSHFNEGERAIGKKLRSGNHVFDIVGVAPKAFFGVEVGKIVDVWTPVSMGVYRRPHEYKSVLVANYGTPSPGH